MFRDVPNSVQADPLPHDVTAEACTTEVRAAEQRLRPHLPETPLEPAPWLAHSTSGRVFLKREDLQPTGSFKVRGAYSKLLSLSPGERARGVVTASTGNHGAAVAHAMRELGMSGTVFVPTTAAPGKVERIRLLGADIREHGWDSALTEGDARRYAAEQGRVYVSPYNDPQVVGGQGTLGVELLRQLPEVDAVFVAVGGGGLISGVAAALKERRPSVRVVGCSPANDAAMAAAVGAGRLHNVVARPTLSDGTAGGVEPGALTFPLCRELVDEWVLVEEGEIAGAMRRVERECGVRVEGAAGVAVAAYLRARERFAGQKVVIVVCGGNISDQAWQELP